jgi:anaerobic selenocysteine-containing dehydrogenase
MKVAGVGATTMTLTRCNLESDPDARISTLPEAKTPVEVVEEEQDAVYESPRHDVPDPNPRGCQKGACYTDLQIASSRVVHPLKRAGERGSGKWQRISWQ